MRLPAQPYAYQGGIVALAHRGFRGEYPENTMLAFEKAAELPIDGLEMDIHSSKDGVLVVHHDKTLERTTNGHGRLQDYTLAELKQLDAGYNFTKDNGQTYPFRGQGVTIPTLEEIFVRFPEMWINVDIKQHTPSIVQPFTQLIRRHNLAEKMCVGSFSDRTVHTFRNSCPEVVRVASLGETFRLFILNHLRLSRLYWGKAHAIQIPEKERGLQVLSKRFVEAAHRNNMAIHIWTVNETADMERFINMGVDGIITDYPNRLLRVLGKI